MSVLEVRGLQCRFGRTWALRDVDLSVGAGEVIALLGENGAGKSTLIKILAGVYQPSAGTIRIGDAQFGHGITAADARSNGLAFVHQDLGLLGELSVAENIAHVAGFERRRGLISWRRQRALARQLLERWEIEIDPAVIVDRLEPTERSLVAIARALATDARVIVFDEPTASLPSHEVELLYQAIDRLRAAGVGALYVTHRLSEVERLAEKAVVLRDGQVVGTVSVKETSQERLVEMIIGRELAKREDFQRPPPGDVVLSLEQVHTPGVADVDLQLCQGEVLALVGLVGAGQRAVGRMVAGVQRTDRGVMSLRGRAFGPYSPREAQEQGIAYIAADRLQEGAFSEFDTSTNYASRVTTGLMRPRNGVEHKRVGRILDDWGVTPRDPSTVFGTLSGGNQQKVLVAKWVGLRPTVLVADEPTAGVDVGAKAAIYDRIQEATHTGLAVLLISSDAEEVVSLADRAVVFREGRPCVELSGEELTTERVALECYRG